VNKGCGISFVASLKTRWPLIERLRGLEIFAKRQCTGKKGSYPVKNEISHELINYTELVLDHGPAQTKTSVKVNNIVPTTACAADRFSDTAPLLLPVLPLEGVVDPLGAALPVLTVAEPLGPADAVTSSLRAGSLQI